MLPYTTSVCMAWGGRGKFGKEGEQRGEGMGWPEGKEGSKEEKAWGGPRLGGRRKRKE